MSIRLVIHCRSLCIAYGGRKSFFFHISLTQKFKDAVSVGAVNITSLYTGTRYPVLHCVRVSTKYGEVVRLTLREDAEDNIIRGFLPRHYGAAIIDEDMAALNNRQIQYYLSYKGKNATSNSPMLLMNV